MSFIWLAAWLFKRRPRVRMFREWNNWGIALGVCLAIDLLSSVGRTARVNGPRLKKSDQGMKTVAVARETKQPVPAVS